jgi:predicted PurR-regulated permease PerM
VASSFLSLFCFISFFFFLIFFIIMEEGGSSPQQQRREQRHIEKIDEAYTQLTRKFRKR